VISPTPGRSSSAELNALFLSAKKGILDVLRDPETSGRKSIASWLKMSGIVAAAERATNYVHRVARLDQRMDAETVDE
jgi:hypothetical protein